MTADGSPDGQQRVLEGALRAFLEHGFHPVQLSDLEEATGKTWPELRERYGDKEGLFLAAADQGLADGSLAAEGRDSEVREMLQRLERANSNPRLRAIHRPSLLKLKSLAENARPDQSPG